MRITIDIDESIQTLIELLDQAGFEVGLTAKKKPPTAPAPPPALTSPVSVIQIPPLAPPASPIDLISPPPPVAPITAPPPAPAAKPRAEGKPKTPIEVRKKLQLEIVKLAESSSAPTNLDFCRENFEAIEKLKNQGLTHSDIVEILIGSRFSCARSTFSSNLARARKERDQGKLSGEDSQKPKASTVKKEPTVKTDDMGIPLKDRPPSEPVKNSIQREFEAKSNRGLGITLEGSRAGGPPQGPTFREGSAEEKAQIADQLEAETRRAIAREKNGSAPSLR